MSKPKEAYLFQDFIDDPTFIAWVKEASIQVPDAWSSYAQTNPDNIKELEKAKRYIQAANAFKRIEPEPHSKKKIWEAINYKTWQSDQKTQQHKLLKRSVLKMAAIFVAIIGSTLLTYKIASHYSKVEEYSAYGEIRKIYLPDSSIVTLSANSSINYYKHWTKDRIREVWVEGEVFFDVKHLHDGQGEPQLSEQFKVNLQNLQIAVLGTSFNVKSRRDIEEVTLASGLVAVNVSRKEEPILLSKPGESIIFHEKTKTMEMIEKPDTDIAWINRIIKLDDTPVKELLEELEDFYGVTFHVLDQQILDKKVDGEFPLTKANDVRFILSSILEKEVTVNKNHITIK
ncbi:FecR domain-containing protein [Belliella sp. DSM 111904]|uniref:FecR domain-containing protein n=1 Tax=Belliella filtrata TaxID=2923435 RepID=A0ABS9UXL5_9BACT|nr:FecR domain-containing protein [Belliella filtrata]MCH7408920.1 FecR domain-containing protein [Belliella filtrata]